MVWSEGNMSLKNPVTTPGIDPGTVRLVAQRLNHYATAGPPQEEMLREYLITTNLNILNKGYKHTFVISDREEVIIHLTLGTDKTRDLVTNWHVSHEIS